MASRVKSRPGLRERTWTTLTGASVRSGERYKASSNSVAGHWRKRHFVKPILFKRHGLPMEVTRHAVWLYFRSSLSFRDVEELLAPRGIDVS